MIPLKAPPGPGTRAPGAMVLDRYRLEASLGTGATAEVWRGIDPETGTPVTLKLLREHLSTDPRAQAAFRGEARLLAMMPAGSVVPVRMLHDGTADWAIVFEEVAGETLAQRIRRGPLAPRDAAAIAADISRSLAQAHAIGLVHRDIKPGNVLLADDGTVRLLDFGIARELDHAEGPATTTGMVVGTLPYLSPERLRGATATPATDVYALGVVLHEMLAGTLESDLPARIDGVPDGLMAIGAAMTLADPSRRLGDAAEVAAALEQWLAGGTVPAGIVALVTEVDVGGATTVVTHAASSRPRPRLVPVAAGLAAASIAIAVVASSVGVPRPAVAPNPAGITGVVASEPSSGTSHGGPGADDRRSAGERRVPDEPVMPVVQPASDRQPDGTARSGDGQVHEKGKDHSGKDKDKDKDENSGKGKGHGRGNRGDGGGGGGGGDDDEDDDDDDDGEG